MLTPIPRTQNVALFVRIKAKHAKTLRERTSLDTDSFSFSDTHLRFKDGHNRAYRVELQHVSPDLIAFIENSHIQRAYIQQRHYRDPSDGDAWVMRLRLLPHNAPAAINLDGIMGVDIGSTATTSVVVVSQHRDREYVRRVPLYERLTHHTFPAVAERLNDYIRESKTRLVRFEDLNPEFRQLKGVHVRLNTFLQDAVRDTFGTEVAVETVHHMFTSQACPRCGQTTSDLAPQYHCRYCGYKGDRDVVAARNIQRGGCVPKGLA